MWNRFVSWAAYANAPEQKLDLNIIEPFKCSISDCFLLSLSFLISQTEAMLIVRERERVSFASIPAFETAKVLFKRKSDWDEFSNQ